MKLQVRPSLPPFFHMKLNVYFQYFFIIYVFYIKTKKNVTNIRLLECFFLCLLFFFYKNQNFS